MILEIPHMNIRTLILLVLVGSLFSCRGKVQEETSLPEMPVGFDSASFDEEDKKKYNKARSIFYSLPSPMETTVLMHKAGATYRQDILNPAENSKNYVTSADQAVNIGAYLADMSYCKHFSAARAMCEVFCRIASIGRRVESFWNIYFRYCGTNRTQPRKEGLYHEHHLRSLLDCKV